MPLVGSPAWLLHDLRLHARLGDVLGWDGNPKCRGAECAGGVWAFDVQAFEEVAQMQQMVGTTGSGMRILVASIRDAAEMARLQAEVRARGPATASRAAPARKLRLSWDQEMGDGGWRGRLTVLPIVTNLSLGCLQGCDTFTFSPAVMDQLCGVASTLQAAADFQQAAERNGKPTP